MSPSYVIQLTSVKEACMLKLTEGAESTAYAVKTPLLFSTYSAVQPSFANCAITVAFGCKSTFVDAPAPEIVRTCVNGPEPDHDVPIESVTILGLAAETEPEISVLILVELHVVVAAVSVSAIAALEFAVV